jgi:hypothetical protein
MTDEHYTADDALDARLRSGLAALVAEAPEPPPFPVDVGVRRHGHRALALAAAAVLLVVAGIASALASEDERNGQVRAGLARVEGIDWVLSEVIAPDGGRLVPPFDSRVRVDLRVSCAGGEPCAIEGSTGCASVGGRVEVEPDRLGTDGVLVDDLGCPVGTTPDDSARLDVLPGLSAAVRRVLLAGPRYEITSESLVLTDGSTRLLYRVPVDADPTGLSDTDWRLEAAHESGVEVEGERAALLSFMPCTGGRCAGPLRIGGTDGCTSFVGDADVTGSELRVTRADISIAGCRDGGPQVLVRAFSRDTTVGFERDGDVLRLRAGTIALDLRRTTERFPATDGVQVVAEGAGAVDEWQLTAQRDGEMSELLLLVRQRGSVATGRGGMGTSADQTDTSDANQVIPLTTGQVVYGFAPARAARVTAQPGGSDPVELELHAVAESDGLQAFAGRTARGPVTIRVWDATGQLILEQTHRPAS